MKFLKIGKKFINFSQKGEQTRLDKLARKAEEIISR
jgi:hypothetical protein